MKFTKKTFIMGIFVLSVNSLNTVYAHHGNHGGGPHVGGPHVGGPHVGGPHVGGPHVGGPHVGGPHVGGPHVGGPHVGGPHVGGPHAGGPHVGGPHVGGPHVGGPHVVVGMPHEHGWVDHRGRNFGWYGRRGIIWNDGNYWYNNRRCYWDPYRYSFVYYDDGLDIVFADQPVVCCNIL